MKKPGIKTLIIGIIGVFLAYRAVTQYLIGPETLYDYGIKSTATVVGEQIEERELGVSTSSRKKKYNVSIPQIQYIIKGDTLSTLVDYWAAPLVDDVQSTNPLLQPGDEFLIYVHPEQTDRFIREGEIDPTNWVGFFLWGGLGFGLLIVFFKRLF